MNNTINKLLERLKQNFMLKIFYRLPFVPWLYNTVLAFLGAVIYGFPSRKIFVVGITGTKGKSTVVELIGYILKFSGKKAALLSSVGMEVAGQREDKPLDNTMPGRFFIQQFLSRAVEAGCQYAIIEVTSEGVKLNRHLFINWSAAIFTNLAPEHIEAHGSFEKYREAKLKFFRYAASLKLIPHFDGRQSEGKNLFFINKDDGNAQYFIKAVNLLKFNFNNIVLYGKSELSSPALPGEFNQYNIGAAAAFVKSQGINEEVIEKALMEFPGVPGRMEFIQREPFAVVVDYAHTPDSLREVYKTLRSIFWKSNFQRKFDFPKLICVLGAAGGGRDKWKRPEMGKIAAEYCDEIILTNEDPFDENPEEIIKKIEKGLISGYPISQRISDIPKLNKILDRKEAIKKAISLAKDGDVVVITGKGSEKWIHLERGRRIPWSDKETTIDILNNK